MGAANFARPENARSYYVVLDNYKDEETGETHALDLWEIEEFDRNFIENLNELETDGWQFVDGDYIQDYSRNYEKTSFGKFYISKQFGDVEVGINIVPFRQNGYYEGATLDYEIQFTGYSCDEYDSIDQCLEDSFDDYYSDMNAGLRSIQKKNAEKWIKPTFEAFEERLDEFFKKQCNINVEASARFSNGETWYTKVE